MIVVEGPDGAGKTTLVQDIVERFHVEVGVRGTANRDDLWKVTLPDTMLALGGAVRGAHPPKVWDRLYFSDFVYAPLGMPPRSVAFNRAHQRHIMGLLQVLACPIILCMPPKAVVVKSIASERHQMPGVKERASDIYDAYDKLFFNLREMNLVVYDFTTDSTDKVFDAIEAYITKRKDREV